MVPGDLSGVEETLARRVLAYARTIAPCLDSLTDEAKADALAILGAVAGEVRGRGPRFVLSQSIGPARVQYADVASCFGADDRRVLRSLCAALCGAGGGLPVGSFPPPDRKLHRLWPEHH